MNNCEYCSKGWDDYDEFYLIARPLLIIVRHKNWELSHLLVVGACELTDFKHEGLELQV